MKALDERDRVLIGAVQDGLPLVPRPFATIAARLGLSEDQVIERLEALEADGVIRRFGVVVRHHELGYTANAMVVWDVADAEVDEVAMRLAAYPFVTLCYRRPRRLPHWPYNLFCMIHGRDRRTVSAQLERLVEAQGLRQTPHEVLFSCRRFKQRGARYAARGAA
ncbi:MAG: AsnC family transcriptional regulator [Candidatus Competibacterales bacterium]|nr:AsnC family transcriptional regulator [Candidatus Competibacterales bacterium]